MAKRPTYYSMQIACNPCSINGLFFSFAAHQASKQAFGFNTEGGTNKTCSLVVGRRWDCVMIIHIQDAAHYISLSFQYSSA